MFVLVVPGNSQSVSPYGVPGQSPLNPYGFFQQGQGQYPPCTPADYGDPSANCMPVRSGAGSSMGYGSFPGAASSLPLQSESPYQSFYPPAGPPMQQDQGRETSMSG